MSKNRQLLQARSFLDRMGLPRERKEVLKLRTTEKCVIGETYSGDSQSKIEEKVDQLETIIGKMVSLDAA